MRIKHMLFPCEVSLKYFLPALRAKVVEELYKMNFSQDEIAKKLGISQAAVSKYINKNYNKEIEKIKNSKEIKEMADEFINNILKNKDVQVDFKKFCEICKRQKLSKNPS
jgi:predicted transcriptional regulator